MALKGCDATDIRPPTPGGQPTCARQRRVGPGIRTSWKGLEPWAACSSSWSWSSSSAGRSSYHLGHPAADQAGRARGPRRAAPALIRGAPRGAGDAPPGVAAGRRPGPGRRRGRCSRPAAGRAPLPAPEPPPAPSVEAQPLAAPHRRPRPATGRGGARRALMAEWRTARPGAASPACRAASTTRRWRGCSATCSLHQDPSGAGDDAVRARVDRLLAMAEPMAALDLL